MQALINANILLPEGLKTGPCLIIENGLIADITQSPPKNAKIYDLAGDYLLPGFIDLQVNGGGGVLFNDNPCIETIEIIAKAHRKYGTTGFFPTLISDDKEKTARAIKAVNEAVKSGIKGVLGIHLEGPFLNRQKKGVHDEKFFRRINNEDIELLSGLEYGKTIVTLAPEMTNPKTINRLAENGIIICAGHSMASYEQAEAAINAGLSGFTHLFNAMAGLHHRKPGLVAAALLRDNVYCGLIADGHHVHKAALRLAIKTKGAGRLFLVTDAMAHIGNSDNSFRLDGQKITVKDGKCITPDGILAGSALDMMSAVKNIMQMCDISLEQAVKMASLVPAQFIGMSDNIGQIRIGMRADLLHVSRDYKIIRSWIGGQAAA